MNPLPYEGYNWSLTQHMGGANERAIRIMLEGAYLLADDPDFRTRFADYLIEQGVYTANVREDSGRADAWRDYQQVLSELGLIVSTALTAGVVELTPIGLMLLDGLLSYEDVITTQAFRYQYPNGHKTALPAAAGDAAVRAGVTKRTELDAASGVLVKPGVLVLRALIDAYDAGDAVAVLGTSEVAAALIPITNHNNPAEPYQRLAAVRRSGELSSDAVLNRNVAEWFSLLLQTGLFSGDRSGLALSATAKGRLDQLRELLTYNEHESFWLPTSVYPEYSHEWFRYFGNPGVESLSQLTVELPPPAPPTTGDKELDELTMAADAGLLLVPFVIPPSAREIVLKSPPAVSEEAMLVGLERRQEKSRLHEEIVGIARQLMLDAGFEVFKSPAVDLIGRRDGEELLVEVKTVTPQNLTRQLRLGTGQLMEYRYRREVESKVRPEALLLISGKADLPDWVVRFFQEDADLGLAYRGNGDEFGLYVGGVLAERVLLAQPSQ